jgi:hypothetical protein
VASKQLIEWAIGQGVDVNVLYAQSQPDVVDRALQEEYDRANPTSFSAVSTWAIEQGIDVESLYNEGVSAQSLHESLLDLRQEIQEEQEVQNRFNEEFDKNKVWAIEQGIDFDIFKDVPAEQLNVAIDEERQKGASLSPLEKSEYGRLASNLLIQSGIDVEKWAIEQNLSSREILNKMKDFERRTPQVMEVRGKAVPPYYYPLYQAMEQDLGSKGITFNKDIPSEKRYYDAADWYIKNDTLTLDRLIDEQIDKFKTTPIGSAEVSQTDKLLNQVDSDVKPHVLTALIKAQNYKALERSLGKLRTEVIRPTSTWEMVKAMPGRMWQALPENIMSSIEGIGSLTSAVMTGALGIFDLGKGAAKTLITRTSEPYIEEATDIVEPIANISSYIGNMILKDSGSIFSGEPDSASTEIGKTLSKKVRNLKSRPLQSLVRYASENPLDFILYGNAIEQLAARGVVKTIPQIQRGVSLAMKTADVLNDTVGTSGYLNTANRTLQAIGTASNKLLSASLTPRKPYSSIISEYSVNEVGDITERIVKSVEFPATKIDDPFINLFIKGSFDETIRKIPVFEQALVNHKASVWVDNLKTQWDNWSYDARKYFDAEFTKLYNHIPKDEQDLISPFLEGKLLLQTKNVHPDLSEEFYDYVAYYHHVTDVIEQDKFRYGYLTREVADNLLYEPISTMTGLTADEIKNELGDLSKLGMAYVKRINSRASNPTHIIEQAVEELTDAPGTRKKVMSQFFRSDVKKKLGFQKKRGRFTPDEVAQMWERDYSIDMREIVPQWIADYTKMKSTEEVINGITNKFGIPVKVKDIKVVDEVKGIYKVGENVYDNSTIFMPEGILKFNKIKTNIYREVINSLDSSSADERLAKFYLETVEKGKSIEDKTLGSMFINKDVSAWLVPKGIEQQLKPLIYSIPTELRLFFDVPQSVWKSQVLGTPKWIVNNAVGNIFFKIMSGTKLGSMTKTFQEKYKYVLPLEMKTASSLKHVTKNEELGKALYTVTGQVIKKIKNSKAFRKVDELTDIPFTINSALEAPFSGGFYIQLAEKEAKKALGDKAAETDIYKYLYDIAWDEKYSDVKQKILSQVAQEYPVFNVTGKFERAVMRRVIPFYNWIKFMGVYSARLPVNHPFKAVALNELGNFSEDKREDLFIENFPFMETYIKEKGIPNRYSGMYPLYKDDDGSVVVFNANAKTPMNTVSNKLFTDPLSMITPLIRIPHSIITQENLMTGREFDTVPESMDKFDENAYLSMPEMVLRESPYYKLAHDLVVQARQYEPKGFFSVPTWSNREVIRNSKTGEIKYPLDIVDTLLNFSGFSITDLSEDSALNVLSDDLKNKMKEFKINQFNKNTNLTIKEMIELTNTIMYNITNKGSKEYQSIFKTIVALKQLDSEEGALAQIKATPRKY